jgi:hypothetical protein
MTNREAFEFWYKKDYWNFSQVLGASGHPLVSYDSEKNRYNQLDVDLAWNAWNAALNCYKVEA